MTTPLPRRRKVRARRNLSPEPEEPEQQELEWGGSDQQGRYNTLSKMTIRSVKRFDWEVLGQYNLADEFENLLESMSWSFLAHLQENCYANLTLEFLSSVNLILARDSQPAFKTITFRLKNKNYSLTPNQVSDAFRMFNKGCKDTTSFDFVAEDAWKVLTNSNSRLYHAAKASKLHSRMMKLLHRFITCSFQARNQSNGTVEIGDLFLLWCAHERKPVHGGHFMIERLVSASRKTSGDICVGPFITHLAKFLDVPITLEDSKHLVKNDGLLGIQSLAGMNILKVIGKTDRNKNIYGLVDEEIAPMEDVAEEAAFMEDSEAEFAPQLSRKRRNPTAGQSSSMPPPSTDSAVISYLQSMETRVMSGLQSMGTRITHLERDMSTLMAHFQLPSSSSRSDAVPPRDTHDAEIPVDATSADVAPDDI